MDYGVDGLFLDNVISRHCYCPTCTKLMKEQGVNMDNPDDVYAFAYQSTREFAKKLNKLYMNTPALWDNDDSWSGFSWISHDDYKQSVIAFRRIDDEGNEIIAVCNFVPVQREDYRIGVPKKGTYRVVFNTDAEEFGGTGASAKSYKSEKIPMHGFKESISMTLAPLSVMYLKTSTRKKAVDKAEKVISETEKKKKSTARKKTTAKK